MSEILDAKIKQKELVNKSSISIPVKSYYIKKKMAALATKAELKTEENKIVKHEGLDSNYFHGNHCFRDDGFQICLFLS